MKGILISSKEIEWFIDMLCNSYGKDDVKDRILGALEMLLTQDQVNYCFDFGLTDTEPNENFDFVLTDTNPNEKWKPIYAEEITHKKGDRLRQ